MKAVIAGSGIRRPDGRWLARTRLGPAIRARFGDPLVIRVHEQDYWAGVSIIVLDTDVASTILRERLTGPLRSRLPVTPSASPS